MLGPPLEFWNSGWVGICNLLFCTENPSESNKNVVNLCLLTYVVISNFLLWFFKNMLFEMFILLARQHPSVFMFLMLLCMFLFKVLYTTTYIKYTYTFFLLNSGYTRKQCSCFSNGLFKKYVFVIFEMLQSDTVLTHS